MDKLKFVKEMWKEFEKQDNSPSGLYMKYIYGTIANNLMLIEINESCGKLMESLSKKNKSKEELGR